MGLLELAQLGLETLHDPHAGELLDVEREEQGLHQNGQADDGQAVVMPWQGPMEEPDDGNHQVLDQRIDGIQGKWT